MSQTRLDFNGSSGKFSSVQAGTLVSEVPLGDSARAAAPVYTFTLGSGSTAVGFTGAVSSGGAYLLEGTVTDGSFSNLFHVSKRDSSYYLINAGSAVTGGTTSGQWTTTSLSTGGVLTLTRTGTSDDTLTASVRKL